MHKAAAAAGDSGGAAATYTEKDDSYFYPIFQILSPNNTKKQPLKTVFESILNFFFALIHLREKEDFILNW